MWQKDATCAAMKGSLLNGSTFLTPYQAGRWLHVACVSLVGTNTADIGRRDEQDMSTISELSGLGIAGATLPTNMEVEDRPFCPGKRSSKGPSLPLPC